MCIDVKTIYIKHYSTETHNQPIGYYFVVDYKERNDILGTEMVNTYHLVDAIVSMGHLKIKNYLTKNFNAKISRYREPYFETKKDVEEALEWLLIKYTETTLIGQDTLKQEKERIGIKNAEKRAKKQLEQMQKDSNTVIEELQKYIGNDITLPIFIGNCKLNFKTKLLNIYFKDGMYCLHTEAGDIKLHYQYIIFENGQMQTKINKRHNIGHIRLNSDVNILF